MLRLIKNEFIKEYTNKRIIITLFLFVGISLCVYLYNIVLPAISQDIFEDREQSYLSTINMYEESKKMYEEEPSPENLFRFKVFDKIREVAQFVKDNNILYGDWRNDAFGSIENIDITILEMLLEGYELSSFYAGGERYSSMTKEEIQQKYNLIKTKNDKVKDIIEHGHYYDYAEIAIKEEKERIEEEENNEIVSVELIRYAKRKITMYEHIIDKKIESKNHYIFKELEHLNNFNALNEFKVLSESDFYKELSLVQSYNNYDEYFEISTNKKEYLNNEIKKAEYAISHNIKYNGNDYKETLDIVIYMFFAIGIFMIVRSGGAISEEQNSGSLRLLLTQGVSRGKVLLSKFISIIIDLYIHYFAFTFIFILVGLLFYQFKDLLMPNIEIIAGNIVLNNYFLYFFKMILISSIPIIFIISFSMFMSIVTLNTIFSIGSNIFIVIIGLFLLNLIKILRIDFLQYTPLPYLDLTKFLYLSNGVGYDSLTFLTSTYYLEKGIVVLILWTIVIYLVTYFIFKKRDIVNQ